MTFQCTVTDSKGKIHKIVREATDREAVISSFLNEDFTPLEITSLSERSKSKFRKPGPGKLLEFTSTFSILLESGLSVRDSISMLKGIIKDRQLLSLVSYIDDRITKGDSFPEIVSGMDTVFPPLYRGLVTVGDRVGTLKTIMPSIRDYLSRNRKVRDKIINSSIYPVIVLFIALAGTIFISVFILPKLQDLFEGIAGASVKTDAIKHNVFIFTITAAAFAALVVITVVLFSVRRKIPSLELAMDRFLLKIPGTGSIIKSIEFFNFTFSVETLLKNGVPLSESIEEASEVVSNRDLKLSLYKIRNSIASGTSLSSAFSGENSIPAKLSRWIGLGEATGNLETIFSQLRIYYESEVENITARFMGFIEPVLILIVGLVVIALVITFIVPLFSLFGTVI